MTEPDVTLTDYALAVEAAVLCALVLRWPASAGRPRGWWALVFASIGIGSLTGGTVHGFFLEPGAANTMLWRATLLALGVTAFSLWHAAAQGYLGATAARWIGRAAAAQLIVYAAIVVFMRDDFVVAIATYAPASVFVLVVMVLAYRGTPSRLLAYGIAGVVLTFVAAAVQQLGLALHPVYFNHNALYHLIQGVALVLIFFGARWFVTRAPGRRSAA